MENQINVSDQNTKQVGQNPVNQPVTLQEKPKVNYWMILTILLGVIVIIGSLYILNLKNQIESNNSKIDVSKNKQQIPSNTPANTFVPTVSQPTPVSSISNWIVYKSIQGYEIKYPSDWFVIEGMVTRFANKKDESQKEGLIVISIFINSDVNMDSMKSRKQIYEEKPNEFKIIRDTVIDGRPAFEFEFLKQPQREIVIAGDLKEIPQDLYTIFVSYDLNKKNNALDVYEQMLSTFKFTR